LVIYGNITTFNIMSGPIHIMQDFLVLIAMSNDNSSS